MNLTKNFSWQAMLCWLTVLLEGYDLVALGAASLALQDAGDLNITPARLTVISTVTLIGVMIGAAFMTPLADVIGRRRVLLVSVATFSLFTVVLPLSPNFVFFAALRLLAGFGLGACMPTALATMSEFRPAGRRTRANTTTMTGYHCGAVAASLLALVLGWQAVFVAGGVIGLVLAVVMWFKLEETATVRTMAERKRETDKVGIVDLLRPRFARRTIAVWVGTFMGLVLVYGLNTWLPTLMKNAGYDVSTSITLLFVLNAGGVVGMLLAGYVGDTRGVSRTAIAWFGIGAALLALLSIQISSSALLNVVIFLAGVFVFSAQVLVYAYVAQSYPERIRGAALGLTSAVGRFGAIAGPLATGILATAGLAYPWGFYLFSAVALLGLLAMVAAPRMSRQDTADPSSESQRGSAAGRV